MEINVTNKDEIAVITNISKKAFDTDINVGCSEIGGPPNYDSEKWHLRMQKSNNLYTIKVNNIIIGGLLLFNDKNDNSIIYVGRIFIDPQYHKMGYGIEAMREIEKIFPNKSTWRLETPIWNIRTNKFYKKLDYIEMERNNDSVFFQKIIKSRA